MFKKFTRRDAMFAAGAFSLILVWIVVSIIKDILAGCSLDEMKYEIMYLVIVAILDFSMITILRGGKESEEENAQKDPVSKLADSYSPEDSDEAPELRDQAEVLAEKYEDPDDKNV